MNEAEMYVLKESLRLVENKVQRDFIELGNLQSTRRNVNFVNSTVEYLNSRLFSFFTEKRPKYSLVVKGYRESDNKNAEFSIYVNSLCGINNLLHAVPYFATVITLKKNNEVIFGLVNSYASNEVFMAIHGRGAFVNDSRLRVSNRTKTDNLLVGIKQDKDRKLFEKIISKFQTFRVTSCYVLDFCYMACGRYDASIVFEGGKEELKFATLLTIEAGGICHRIGGSDNDMVFSNAALMDEIKNALT
jgi:myo-inositol-1(or 4)-monophosphatase